MVLTSFLFVAGLFCLANGASRFNFRDYCTGNYLGGKYSVRCNATKDGIIEKDLILDDRSTRGVNEMILSDFKKITLQESVRVEKIKITRTEDVSLFINNLILKDLIIESVDRLILRNQRLEDEVHLEEMISVTLTNVNTLQLNSEVEFQLPVKTLSMKKVGDIALGSSKLTVSAINVTIEESKVRLQGDASLVISAVAMTLNRSHTYIFNGGYLNITATSVKIEGSHIDLEQGTINLVNPKDVTFSKNSLTGFEKASLTVSGSKLPSKYNVKFIKNDIFLSNVMDVLCYDSNHFTIKDNIFDCTSCVIKDKLLVTDLRDIGDVNFCYTTCNLSLNHFKQLINNRCFCNTTSANVDYTAMCAPTDCEYEVTVFDLFKMVLILTISFICLATILFFLCYKSNVNKFKTLTSTSSSNQELGCNQNVVVYKKPCFENDDCIYEEVRPPSVC